MVLGQHKGGIPAGGAGAACAPFCSISKPENVSAAFDGVFRARLL